MNLHLFKLSDYTGVKEDQVVELIELLNGKLVDYPHPEGNWVNSEQFLIMQGSFEGFMVEDHLEFAQIITELKPDFFEYEVSGDDQVVLQFYWYTGDEF